MKSKRNSQNNRQNSQILFPLNPYHKTPAPCIRCLKQLLYRPKQLACDLSCGVKDYILFFISLKTQFLKRRVDLLSLHQKINKRKSWKKSTLMEQLCRHVSNRNDSLHRKSRKIKCFKSDNLSDRLF